MAEHVAVKIIALLREETRTHDEFREGVEALLRHLECQAEFWRVRDIENLPDDVAVRCDVRVGIFQDIAERVSDLL